MGLRSALFSDTPIWYTCVILCAYVHLDYSIQYFFQVPCLCRIPTYACRFAFRDDNDDNDDGDDENGDDDDEDNSDDDN